VLVLILLSAWIAERRVMRDAEACSARSFSIGRSQAGLGISVSYLFMGERGEYYGGHSRYFELNRSPELGKIVFYKIGRPEVNKIAMGFLFHKVIVLGRGIKDLDKETVALLKVVAETMGSS
jgi:hypothetical protein